MNIAISVLVIIIALQHVGFLILEMFMWTKPVGLKIFGQTSEHAQISAKLAANQGLYNGFLAAGLIWSLLHPSEEATQQIQIFFLCCVAIAGIYGGHSVNKRIFLVQAVPAFVTLALLIAS